MKREAQPLYREYGVADFAPVLKDFDQRMPGSSSARTAAAPMTSAQRSPSFASSMMFSSAMVSLPIDLGRSMQKRLFGPVRSFSIERKFGGVDCIRFADGSVYLIQFADA